MNLKKKKNSISFTSVIIVIPQNTHYKWSSATEMLLMLSVLMKVSGLKLLLMR